MSFELPSDWDLATVGDVAAVKGGGTPKTSVAEYWDGDVPWLTPRDLRGTRPRHVARGERMLTGRGLAESSTQLLPEGTVLVSSRAPIGYCAIAANPIATNQGFKSLVVKDGFCPEYYYYVMLTKVPEMEAVAGGSTFKEISGKTMKTIGVPVPPYQEQVAIAEVLGSLDDRIEWCRNTAATVLELSQRLWSSASAKNETVRLGEVVNFHNRDRVPLSSLQRAEMPGKYRYYGATGVFDYINDYRFDGEFVLIGEDGSVVKDDGTGVVQYAWGKFWVNNHAHVVSSADWEPFELFLSVSMAHVRPFVTGAVQPKLSMGRLKQVPVQLPDHDSTLLRQAVSAAGAFYRLLCDSEDELTELRDVLLTRLVYGWDRVDHSRLQIAEVS